MKKLSFSVAIVVAAFSSSAFAQSTFRAVAEVGDQIVTSYEVQQRILFLEIQGAQGDLADRALEELIDERLRASAIANTGIRVTADQIDAAIEEIAQRTDRQADEFLADLGSRGVDLIQFRQTTAISLAWRELIQRRYGPAASATDAEVDRELGLAGGRGLVEVRFAEIFLPMNTPNNIAISQDLMPQIRNLTNFAEFSDAARRFSVGGTRENGGLVEGWVPITNIPAEIRQELTRMRPGQVTSPVDFNGAVGLFQLRGIREAKAPSRTAAIDFMTFRVPRKSGRDINREAEQIVDQIDSCNDLYGIAINEPDEFLTRQTLALRSIEGSVATQLNRLDPGESAVVPDSNGNLQVVTLCARVATAVENGGEEDSAAREALRREIANRKLGALAEAYLQELRGETVIRLK